MKNALGEADRKTGTLVLAQAWEGAFLAFVMSFTLLCWIGVPILFIGPESVAPYRSHVKSVLDLAAGADFTLMTAGARFIAGLRLMRWLVLLGLVSLVSLSAARGNFRLRLGVYLTVLWIDFLLLCVLLFGIFSMLV